MSEKHRKKKAGEDKNKKSQRLQDAQVDEKQNVDRPGVHKDQLGPNPYDEDLKKANREKD